MTKHINRIPSAQSFFGDKPELHPFENKIQEVGYLLSRLRNAQLKEE